MKEERGQLSPPFSSIHYCSELSFKNNYCCLITAQRKKKMKIADDTFGFAEKHM